MWKSRNLLLFAVPMFFSSFVFSQECDWLQKGLQGFTMQADETSCQRLFQWDALLEERERAALKAFSLYSDPEYEFLLSGMILKMQKALEHQYGPQPEYEIHLVADNAINAAASGAQIFVNRGTILFYLEPRKFWLSHGYGPSQAEELWSQVTPWENDIGGLAFILAHEVGHNILQHPPNVVGFICDQHLDYLQQTQARVERREARNEELEEKEKKVGFWRKLGRALNTGMEESLSSYNTSFNTSFEFSEYQQNSEYEADTLGVLILKEMGLEPKAGARSLGYLATIYGYSDGNSAFIKTFLCSDHPHILNRISKAKSLANQISINSRYANPDWPKQEDLNPLRIRYAWTKYLSSYNSDDYRNALFWMDQSLQFYPNEATLIYNKACMHSRLGQEEQALANLRRSVSIQKNLRDLAKKDVDFATLRNSLEFQSIVGIEAEK